MAENKKQEEKNPEYPIIYTYIYEREGQDIKRLYNAFKNVKPKKNAVSTKKIITSVEIVNGVPRPIYGRTHNTTKNAHVIGGQKTIKKVGRKGPTKNTSVKASNKGAVVKGATKSAVVKRSTKNTPVKTSGKGIAVKGATKSAVVKRSIKK